MDTKKVNWEDQWKKFSESTKAGLEKLWDISLDVAEKGSKHYKLMTIQRDIYFLKHKIAKMYTLFGEKVYQMFKDNRIRSKKLSNDVDKIDEVMAKIGKLEKKIEDIKKKI